LLVTNLDEGFLENEDVVNHALQRLAGASRLRSWRPVRQVAELGEPGRSAPRDTMNSAAHFCPWLAIGCFTAAVVWALLLGVDSIRRTKLLSLGGLLSVLSLFAFSLMSLGGMVIFAEIGKRQRGLPPTTDGVMYFVFCAAAGVALQGIVLIVWVGWILTRKRSA
jgi:hypothetical protein